MQVLAAVLVCLGFQRFVLAHGNRERRSLSDYIKHYEPLYYDQDVLLNGHHRVRRSFTPDTSLELNFHAHGRHFPLRLKRDTKSFSDSFVPEHKDFEPANIYRGEIENDPGSVVHGFIYNRVFEGRIVTSRNEEFFIEPSNQYVDGASFHSVIYNSKDVHYPHPHGPGCGIKKDTHEWMKKIQNSAKPADDKIKFDAQKKYSHERNKRAVGGELGVKTTCQLYVQADWTFTERFAGDKVRAMYLMNQYVQSADHVFKRTDFSKDGNAEGISFVIARMTANNSKDCDNTCPFKDPNLGVEFFLGLNSDLNHDDFCLAYIFTHRDFADGVLGLAWIAEEGAAAGGICEKYRTLGSGKPKSLNTGIVTTLNYQKKVPGKVIYITLSHEIGHNFGSKHDPSTTLCAPGASGGSGGNFIMFPRATSGAQTNNDLFSSCSKDFIWPVLKAKSGNCFKEASGPICGNRIVETGEECDCGFDSECTDSCCEPKRTGASGGCKFRGKALNVTSPCSPSNGPCCNSSSCTFLSANSTICRTASECAGVASCDGTSAACPAPPAKPDITTVCSEGAKVCINGTCTGSICLKHNKQECMCTTSDHFCDICCKNSTTNTCKSQGIKLAPGSPCDQFLGYCDILHKCRKVDAEGPLSRLKKFFFSAETLSNILTWMKEYWWGCVLIGLGVVFFMAGFIKVCSVHTPSSNPNMKAARPMTLPRSLSRRRRPPNATAPPHVAMNHPPAYDDDPLPGYNTAIREPAPSGPPRGYRKDNRGRHQQMEMSHGYRY